MNLKNYDTNAVSGNPDGASSKCSSAIGENETHPPPLQGEELLRKCDVQFPSWEGSGVGSTLLENLLRLVALALALLCVAATALQACGPCFPNHLLVGGDEALLSAPVADFERELQRLNLAPSRFVHRDATHGYEAQTMEAEVMDLGAALKRAKVSPEESERILEAHRVNRKRLSEYLDACSASDSKAWNESAPDKRGPQPAFPAFEEVPGLPGEFADYFAGAAALHNPGAGDSFRERSEERRVGKECH